MREALTAPSPSAPAEPLCSPQGSPGVHRTALQNPVWRWHWSCPVALHSARGAAETDRSGGLPQSAPPKTPASRLWEHQRLGSLPSAPQVVGPVARCERGLLGRDAAIAVGC